MASSSPTTALDLLSSSSKKQPFGRPSTPTRTASSAKEKDSSSRQFRLGGNPHATPAARKIRPPQIQIVPIAEPDSTFSTSSLDLDLDLGLDFSSDPATASAFLLEQTTAPIPIPTANPLHRRNPISRPTTPLTAREEKAGHEFPWHDTSPLRPTISQSLRPTYSFQRPSERKAKEFLPQPQQLVSKATLRMQEDVPMRKYNVLSTDSAQMHQGHASSLYTPSSPLSPTMTSAALPSHSRHGNARRTGQPLQLPALPRYHPSNYERATTSPSLSTNVTSRPSATYRSSARSPQPHQRQLSDAQYKLHQYQRDVITTATRQSRPAASSTSGITKPVSPRLNPLGSPGPVTPMMLEEQTDYLLAGAERCELSSNSFEEPGQREPGQRELVERLVRAGKEPGVLARSGSSSPVGPAGGRG
ncbi:MAG: hypothetical protein LQ347_002638 [Umbilicaria vellea]|nr:MAG: hypothetical protein LQ347_002638 [Umbilicaria vellea]